MITLTLPEITQKFLNDHAYIEGRIQYANERKKTLPVIQSALHDFIQGTITFTQLKDVLNQMKHPWYAAWNGTNNAIMEINIFAKNHLANNIEAGEPWRVILRDLDAHTVGQTIEQCYLFLRQERDRLRPKGLSNHAIAKPASSAYIISLFAIWLDPEGDIIVCTQSGRKSMNWLVREGVIPGDPDLKLKGNNFVLQTRAQYEAYLSRYDYIKNAAPQITSLPYWRESFIWWFRNHHHELVSQKVS